MYIVWRFSKRRWMTFQPFLWIIYQFHHGILEPPMKRNLCHCQFVLMFSNIHSSSDHYRLKLPPLAVRLLQSTQSFHGLCRTRHPPTVADYHDTPAVTGGLHPLLDIAPKNRRLLTGHRQDDVDWFCVSRWGSIPHNRYETGREKPGKRWLVCVSGVWMH